MWVRWNFFTDAMPFLWIDRAQHLFINIPGQPLFHATSEPDLVPPR